MVHALGLLSLIPLGSLAWPVVVIGLLGLGASAWQGFHRDWRLTAQTSIHRVEWRDDGAWFLQCGHHPASQPGRLLYALVTRPLVILTFSLGGLKRRYLVLWPDSLDPAVWRRLRVRLRWGQNRMSAPV